MIGRRSRVIPVTLLALLAMTGLRGALSGPHRAGPLRGDGLAVGLAVGLALEAVLAVLLVITVRRGPADGEDVPGKLRLALRYLLGAGMAAVAVALLLYAHLRLPAEKPRPRPTPARPLAPPSARPQVTGGFHIPAAAVYGLLIAVLVAALAVSIWWSVRRLRPPAPARDTAGPAADTPDELLTRATAAGAVRGTAAGRLVALFYEARFSSHPLGGRQRQAAERALAELAAGLGAAPVPAAGGRQEAAP
jgi:hypothetical protein